jgi:nucleotide-binding universal stress UspA family protein
MFKHILVATDGSDRSKRAIEMAMALARSVGAKVTAVAATWPVPPLQLEGAGIAIPNDVLDQNMIDFARRSLEVAVRAAAAQGVGCETVHVVRPQAYEAILETAKNCGCDLIVMASHGRAGASALLLGSETSKVLAHATLPVLVCR